MAAVLCCAELSFVGCLQDKETGLEKALTLLTIITVTAIFQLIARCTYGADSSQPSKAGRLISHY
jgi:hypothetical protein